MLAGPPRLVSILTVLLLFLLAGTYMHLRHAPLSSSQLSVGSHHASSVRGDPLDFGLPLRFSEGRPKPAGSNYSYAVVIPKTMKESLDWLNEQFPDMPLVVYEVDNPEAINKIPKNKGREAMVYLSYMIDHYDNLPDIVIFMHSHKIAWHNNLLQGQDASQMLPRLNHERVARLGYMNVRCHHEPGCPDWIHMDRPGGDFDFFHKPEEIHWRRNIWEEVHPGAPIPPSLSGVCCAQFAVSGQRIRDVPIERFHHYRKWLLNTGMEDQYSGRVFEYIWHYIFTGHEVYCPAQNSCYCDGYGICFGGRQAYEDYWERQGRRDKDNSELEGYKNMEKEAKEKGEVKQFTDKEKARMGELDRLIRESDVWLWTKREEAVKRGEDPKARKEETETYDSSHIWDYAPGGARNLGD